MWAWPMNEIGDSWNQIKCHPIRSKVHPIEAGTAINENGLKSLDVHHISKPNKCSVPNTFLMLICIYEVYFLVCDWFCVRLCACFLRCSLVCRNCEFSTSKRIKSSMNESTDSTESTWIYSFFSFVIWKFFARAIVRFAFVLFIFANVNFSSLLLFRYDYCLLSYYECISESVLRSVADAGAYFFAMLRIRTLKYECTYCGYFLGGINVCALLFRCLQFGFFSTFVSCGTGMGEKKLKTSKRKPL